MVILQRCGIWWTILPIGYKEATSINYFKNSLFPLFIFRPPININSIGGFVGDTNTASALLGMCLPAFFRKKWHWFIPLILIGFLIIHSFGGIVAGTVALIVFLIFKFGKRSLYGIIPVGLLFISYFIRFENLQNIFISGSNRFEVWRFYIQHLIPKRWIIGWGLGQGEFLWSIIEKETSFKNVMYWHSHNEIITMTAELGLIGLVIICGYFFTTLKNLKDPVIICGLIACLTASLSIFTFHSAIGLILIVYMAIAHYQLLTNKEVSNV
jgi:O-antigen ligase